MTLDRKRSKLKKYGLDIFTLATAKHVFLIIYTWLDNRRSLYEDNRLLSLGNGTKKPKTWTLKGLGGTGKLICRYRREQRSFDATHLVFHSHPLHIRSARNKKSLFLFMFCHGYSQSTNPEMGWIHTFAWLFWLFCAPSVHYDWKTARVT